MNYNTNHNTYTHLTAIAIIALVCILSFTSSIDAVPWMFQPTSEPHSLSNNYCEMQTYGSPYYHDGIDVIKPTGGVPVYSVSDGWMTHEASGTMYGGIMIGNTYAAGDSGWLYWHLPNSTFPFNVGDRINEGDYIGDIAYWSVYSFHHVHFSMVVGTSGLPWGWYEAIDNPLDWMEPSTDDDPPTIYNALGTNLLAFCVDNTSNYLDPDNLSGNVDIIAKIGDLCLNDYWEIAPYRIEYSITGATVNEHYLSFVFNDWLPASNTVTGTVYKDDYTCNSEGDYDDRDFFFILTNHDDDEIIEYSDRNNYWDTDSYPGGTYTITVDAWDAGGNLTQDSMEVTIAGTPSFTVDLTYNYGSPVPAGGGNINFDVFLQNNETTSQDFDLWIEIPPQVTPPSVPNRNLTFPAGHTLFRPGMNWPIAASWPAGNYEMDWNIGDLATTTLWASDSFPFSKSVDDDGSVFTLREIEGDPLDQLFEGTEFDGASSPALPEEFALLGVYPNPFNPVTSLRVSLPEAGFVKLAIYDISGRMVSTLIDEWRDAGVHQATFDGSNLSTGIFVSRLTAGDRILSGKMLLMK